MATWGGVSLAYRDSFSSLCAGTSEQILVDLSGERLLDVGCGTGVLLARAIEQGRAVTGVDAEPDMVAMSLEVAPGRVVEAALPSLPFPDGEFPAVAANFVANHVPDPRAAMRELARVTAPGGRAAVTIWPAGGAGWSDLVDAAFAAGGALSDPGTRLPKHLDFPRSVEGLAMITEQAALSTHEARELIWTWRITPEALWTGISGGAARSVGQ